MGRGSILLSGVGVRQMELINGSESELWSLLGGSTFTVQMMVHAQRTKIHFSGEHQAHIDPVTFCNFVLDKI